MRNVILLLVLAAIVVLGGASSGSAQIWESGKFTVFYDSISTYNGQLIPRGSIIKAYDPQDVWIGQWVSGVDLVQPVGYYGFMNAYGEDPTEPGDNGADDGDTIRFTINDRPATVVDGDPTFADQSLKRVQLSASAAVVMTVVEVPTDKAATFDRVVQFRVRVKNDGDGLDFYHIRTVHSDTSFHTITLDSFVYATPGQTVDVDFEVRTPIFVSNPDDTVDVITFHVNSGILETQSYESTVNLVLSITDVDDGGDTGLPTAFALHQNYPNPFNPTTTIAFTLPRSSAVRLEVIDALGRTVEERDLGVQSAGEHTVTYNGSNLASGIYFYRITTAFGSESRKMLLVK